VCVCLLSLPVFLPVLSALYALSSVLYSEPSLGSENRDRGGIQLNSEPTSPPEPLLKINTIYVCFSGLSNV